MLLRRLKSLQHLQNCRAQLEKATKPQKKEAVSSLITINLSTYMYILYSCKFLSSKIFVILSDFHSLWLVSRRVDGLAT